jgi:RAD51-like protein 1
LLLQVTARIDDGAAAGPQRPGGQLKAALGTKWAHCVNVRLVLERYHQNRFIKVSCRAVRGCFWG